MSRIKKSKRLGRLGWIAIMIVVVISVGGCEDRKASQAPTPPPPAESGTIHAVVINHPAGTPLIDSGEVDRLGQPIQVSCANCHATLDPNRSFRSGEQLKEFHQGLTVAHGDLTCLSCHNADNYDTLKLADGQSVSYEKVMDLCSQCHGIQARNYHNGAHGGMTGYWDLSRGGRQRNNCIDCHDPHAPKYPTLQPVFKPVELAEIRNANQVNQPNNTGKGVTHD